MERVQKVIANNGYCSRRKAEELIKLGKVFVNDKVASLGDKVSGNDIITIDGETINKDIKKEYYILNKPREVICSVSDDKGRKTVVDLINDDRRIYPVGRLDYDTTGALILTNDGEFANLMMLNTKACSDLLRQFWRPEQRASTDIRYSVKVYGSAIQ